MKKQFERLYAARVGKGEGGFTLIELLIVIVILGILAAVVVFSVSGITKSGKKSACKADLQSIQTAVEAKRANDGSYPTDMASLMPKYLGTTSDIAVNTKTSPDYVVTYAPPSAGPPPTPATVTADHNNCNDLGD